MTPKVSIITATYNRSNVLAYAVKSALAQTMDDWEMIVVGDACTDDTERVVAAFSDPRIEFHNLAENVGEQSGPNNEGFRRSRGRYIAYLNHDDIWLPGHLASAVREIERNQCDLVFSLMSSVRREGTSVLVGSSPTGRYEPHLFVPASSWVLHRELAEEIGPWRFYRDCRRVPSQDWLLHAHQAGRDLRLMPKLTVIQIPSSDRPGSYSNRDFKEHQTYYDRITQNPAFLEDELTRMCIGYAARDVYSGGTTLVWPHLIRAFKNGIRWLFASLGLEPEWLRQPRRGSAIDRARNKRGLPRIPRA